MLNTVFYSLINMSIFASIIGLLLLMLRKIKYIPRQAIYWMWTLVLLKLIIPFSVSSRVSILNLTGSLVKKVVAVPGMEERSISLSMSNSIGAADTYFPVTFETNQVEKIFSIASYVWIIGVAGSVILAGVIYFITCSRLKSATAGFSIPGMNAAVDEQLYINKPVKNFNESSKKAAVPVYICEKIDTPMVQGVFRQRILIPKGCLGEPGLKYIILHENVHVKRKDNLIRIVSLLIACLHWFNPLAWIFMNKFTEDMEFTCDLRAVKELTSDERKDYAQTLLAVGTERQYRVMSAFGSSSIGKRVINVLSYKKISVFSLALILIFVTVVAAALLTNPLK